MTVRRPTKFNAFGAKCVGEGHDFAEEKREAACARCKRHKERLVNPAMHLVRQGVSARARGGGAMAQCCSCRVDLNHLRALQHFDVSLVEYGKVACRHLRKQQLARRLEPRLVPVQPQITRAQHERGG